MRKPSKNSAPLDISVIITTALELADREGLDAVSMRRVAAELEVTPMALYYYVPNKEQLIDLMADEALHHLPTIDQDGDWETELERYLVGLYRLFVAHPALAEVMTHRPLEGPIAVSVGEQLFALLTASGFEDGDAVDTFIVLFNYTIGAGVYRLSRDRPKEQRLANVTAAVAPVTYRLRRRFATAGSEPQFVAGLRRIIETYRPAA